MRPSLPHGANKTERVSLHRWRVLYLSYSDDYSFLVSQEGTKDSEGSSQALHSSTTVVTPTAEPVVSTPVVVKSNDESEHKDQETDAEKDPELNGVQSDAEGSVRGGRGGEQDGNISSTCHLNFIQGSRGRGQQRGGRGNANKGKK